MERSNMLSIIVLFCDKDMWHIPGLVEYIKETCKGDYEVVLVDNRKEKNTPPPDTGWPVYEAPGIGTFEGRRFALSKCRGKYVWFIDADDKILDWSAFINPDRQDADFIFYNSTIMGEISSIDSINSLSPLLKNFKAVKENNVWCTGENLYQETTDLGQMILEFNRILSGETDGTGLKYMKKLK